MGASMTGAWSLHLGECLEWMRGLEAGSVDHTIMDPPYSEHVHRNARSAIRKVPLHDGAGNVRPAQIRRGISRGVDFGFSSATPELIEAWSVEVARVTRRWVAVFSDVESCHLWRGALERAGLEYLRTVFWDKVCGAPQFSGDRPAVACEAITLAHSQGRKRWNGGGKRGIYSVPIELNRGGVLRRFHPTAKPLALMLALIEDFTDPGELVLDPFAGSATTGVAAVRLGRRFLGAEQDPVHHATAVARLAAEEAAA